MKLLGKLILFLVVVLAVVVLARNTIVKAVVESGVGPATGLPVKLGKLDINFSKTLLDIENFEVKNPSGFHGTSLVEVPKLLVDYNLSDILKGNIHLENIEFDMKQFTVVKNEKGQLNLDSVKALQGTQKPSTEAQGPVSKAPAKPIPVQIDLLTLKIGKVVYEDYSSGSPVTKTFNINFNESYRNITDLNAVARMIVLKAMMSSGISNLVNFDIQGLSGTMTDVLNSSAQMATQKAEAALKATTGEAAAATNSLVKKLKLPFGKSES